MLTFFFLAKGASDAEQGEFLWNISEFNTAASNMFEAPESPYTLATADAEVIAISHLFNIEGIISLPSLNTSIYTSSSLSASSTGSPSRPPSTSSTKGLSSPSPTDVPKSVAPKSELPDSSRSNQRLVSLSPNFLKMLLTSTGSTSTNNQLYSGLGIAGGLFFLLSIIVFGIYFLVKRSRKRRSESEKQSKHLSTKPFEHNSSTAAETISFKSELPTLFNVPRAMRSTFLVKYELPGAENELPSAPYELSAESSSRFNR